VTIAKTHEEMRKLGRVSPFRKLSTSRSGIEKSKYEAEK
jgi:hypothetical protein